jgi:glycosyltransferase involved in cell wall biosynthesis
MDRSEITEIRKLIDLGNLEGAERTLEKSLKQAPDSTELLDLQAEISLKLGSSLWKKGDVDRAIDYLTKALEIRPSDRNIVLKCGEVLTSLEQTEAARNLYSSYLQKNPGDKEIAMFLKNMEKQTSVPSETRGNKKPEIKVSAIVSAYNSERFMRGCLEDLVNQTLYQKDELEIVVIDSGSEQNEGAIVKEFQKQYENIVYMRTEKRETVYASWNRGIKAARGKYITNANSDDRHRRDALETMSNVLDSNSEIGLVYADTIITATENETFEKHTPAGYFQWIDYSRELLSLSCFIGPQPMWRKSLHDRYGFFDETFVSSGDWEFWLRIADGTKIFHIPEFLGLYLYSHQSAERRAPSRKTGEDSRLRERYLDRYLGTAEDVDKGIEFIEKIEMRAPGSMSPWKAKLMDRKSSLSSGLPQKSVTSKDTAIDLLIQPARSEAADSLVSQQQDTPVLSAHEAGKEKAGLEVEEEKETRGLVSIILLLSNQQDRSRRCLDSIKKYTKETHDIFFVPADASSGQPKWLRNAIKGNSKRYRLVKSDEKAGFSKAHNLGIKESSGKFIVLLNDSLIMTENWLTGMLECLDKSDDTGIVGPMMTAIEGPQGVSVSEHNLKDFDQYSRSFRERNRYRCVPVKHLKGPCLLFRRELLDKTGLLDELFLLPDFAIEDFCLRASIEGFRNFIAGDILISHDKDMINTAWKRMFFKDKKNYISKWSKIDSQDNQKLVAANALTASHEFNEKGDFNQAVAVLIDGIRYSPEDNRLHFALVKLLSDSKNFGDALDILETMPAALRQTVQWMELFADCKIGLEQLSEAEKFADAVLAQDERSSKAYNLKGLLAYKNEAYADAERLFQEAINLDRSFGEPYANLGALRWLTKNFEEPISLFERAFILSPEVMEIAVNYHSAAVSSSRLEQAEKTFKEAVSLHPLNKNLKFMLIDILLQQEKHQESMDLTEDALLTFGINDDSIAVATAVREKIGPKSPSLNVSQSVSTSTVSISLCMIVKNEEKNVGRCLKKIGPLVDEMIVVDTGSADRTRDIAKIFGAKVYDFEWTDSFSDARNFSLSKASGEWLLVLDADEVIAPEDFNALKKLLKSSSRSVAYSFNTRNYLMPVNAPGWIANDGMYFREEAGTGWYPSRKVRLFPNDKRICFKGPVHEFVENSLIDAGITVKNCDVPIHHYGKLNKDKTIEKGRQYYELGKSKKAERGDDDPVAIYELAVQASELEQFEQSLSYWKRFVELQPDFSKGWYGLGNTHIRLNQFEDAFSALDKAVNTARDHTEWRDAVVLFTYAAIPAGKYEESIKYLEQLLQKDQDYPMALLLLSAAFICTGKKEEGVGHLAQLRKLDFDSAPYLVSIAQLLISAGKPGPALSLLEIMKDINMVTVEVPDLIAECEKKIEESKKTHKESRDTETHADALIQFETNKDMGEKDPGVQGFENSSKDSLPNKATFMSFPLAGNLSEKDQKDCGQAAMTEGNKNIALLMTNLAKDKSSGTLSLCMIVKNEEEYIARALRNVKPLVDEMIVVDTGSTDRTRDIAKELGARVFNFSWNENFSDARNFSISKASGQWILVLDADEIISPSDFEKLKELVGAPSRTSNPVAFSFTTRNYLDSVKVGYTVNDGKYSEEAGVGWIPSDKVRLFPNNRDIRFENAVHEMVEPSLRKLGFQVIPCDIPIHHYGKLDRTRETSKYDAYYQLGKKKLSEKQEKSPHSKYELAIQALQLEKYDDALFYFNEIIEEEPGHAKSLYGLGTAYLSLGQFDKALNAFRRATEIHTGWQDAEIMLATCEILTGRHDTAIAHLERLIKRNDKNAMVLFTLAAGYFCSGEKAKSENCIKKLQNLKFDYDYNFISFAKMLMLANRFKDAVSLLKAFAEYSNKPVEIENLLSECEKKIEETIGKDSRIIHPSMSTTESTSDEMPFQDYQ